MRLYREAVSFLAVTGFALAGCQREPAAQRTLTVATAAAPEKTAPQLGGKTVVEWRQVLRSKDRVAQYSALEELARLDPEPKVLLDDVVEVMRKDPDDNVRVAAGAALNKLGAEPGHVPALVELLDDPQVRVRQEAVAALGSLGADAKAAVPALMGILKGNDPYMQELAATALGAIGNEARAAAPLLANAAQSKNGAAIGALGSLGEVGVPLLIPILLESDDFLHSRAQQALAAAGKPAVKPVMELADHREARIRQAVVKILGDIGPPAAAGVDVLRRGLQDCNPDVRCSAVEAFYGLGPAAKPALAALLAVLTDPDWKLRQTAAHSIGAIGPDAAEAVPSLAQALGDEYTTIRATAAYALGKIGPKAAPAVPALTKLLEDKERKPRRDAAYALGAIGAEAKPAVPQLRQAFNNREDISHLMAAAALMQISPEDRDAALAALRGALKSAHKDVRCAAIEALAHSGPRGLTPMCEALKDPDREVRWQAAYQLEKLGVQARTAVPALLEAYKVRDDRHRVKQTLKSIDPEAAAKAGIR